MFFLFFMDVLHNQPINKQPKMNSCDTCGKDYDDCVSCECPDDCKCLKLCEEENGGRCPHYPYDDEATDEDEDDEEDPH